MTSSLPASAEKGKKEIGSNEKNKINRENENKKEGDTQAEKKEKLRNGGRNKERNK
jgi:hypothetical protein